MTNSQQYVILHSQLTASIYSTLILDAKIQMLPLAKIYLDKRRTYMYASYESYFTTALTICSELEFTWLFMASAIIAALFTFAFAINSLFKHEHVLPKLSLINEMPESDYQKFSDEETETYRIFAKGRLNKDVYEKRSYRQKLT